MKGVWSWSDHIQAIHSQNPILRSVYETVRATQEKKTFRWMNKISLCKMKELIVHPIVQEHLCGNLKVPIGFPKFPMEFPRGREVISWDNI
jgi:hypothetical protein